MFEQLVREPEVKPVKLPSVKELRTRDLRVKCREKFLASYIPNPWGLSPQQFACMDLISNEDASDSELADILCISKKTFSTHLTRARESMGTRSIRAATIRFDRWKQNQQGSLPETPQQLNICLEIRNGQASVVSLEQKDST